MSIFIINVISVALKGGFYKTEEERKKGSTEKQGKNSLYLRSIYALLESLGVFLFHFVSQFFDAFCLL